MSLPIYQRVAVTDAGDIIPGAEYTVINENTGVAAPIYSDRTGATLLTAPYFADSAGTIQFFIAQGTTFRVAASGGVGTYTDRYVYGVADAVLVQANGNVGIGTISPSEKLTIQGDGADILITDSAGGQTAKLGSTGSNNGLLELSNSAHTGTVFLYSSGNSYLNGGNFGIGTSLPISKMHIDGPEDGTGGITISAGAQNHQWFLSSDVVNVHNIASGSAGAAHTWQMGGVEKMRLEAAGNLLVGTTSQVPGGASGTMVVKGANPIITQVNSTSGSAAAVHFYDGSNNFCGQIQVQPTSNTVSYLTSSDVRLKKNIEDADDAGLKIDSIRVRKFDWIAGGPFQDYGMVAQELKAVAPEAVSASEDPEEMLGVDYSKLVPILVKEVQSLRARVAALEALEAK